MRDDLNEILIFIGATSLTDEEFDSIELEDLSDEVANYNALLSILESRESVSATRTRLQNYFLAKGVDVAAPSSGQSNIFVGGTLCD